MNTSNKVDEKELEKFEAMASEWWDPNGKFKPLHMLNPCRLNYIINQIKAHTSSSSQVYKPFEGLKILDIGCGGGLLSEPMSRLGGSVLGVDPVEKNIIVAQLHSKNLGLDLEYKKATAEDLVDEKRKFDVILNMEVVEHVPNPTKYLQACSSLLNDGGLLICSTINRTKKSYLWAIIGAEYVMRWLPKNTHDWKKFITPGELEIFLETSSLKLIDKKGFLFNFLKWDWQLSSRDLSVNYVTTSVKI